jgi:hypothetical protein
MELHKIESLLEKYFEGETSVAEENQLKDYFSSADVAPQFEPYRPMFSYFNYAKSEKSEVSFPLQSKKRNHTAWLSVAASVAVLLGVGFMFFNQNQPEDLGTFDSPEVAMRETQKALDLLSGNVNKGIEGMQYVQEYEDVKSSVFPQNNH